MLRRLFGKNNKTPQAQTTLAPPAPAQAEIDSLFLAAIQSHDLIKAKEYAARGADISTASNGHTPALISSLRDQRPDLTDWLLTQKPDLEFVDRLDKTALMTAADNGADWVDKIIKAGADPDTKNSKGWTALEYALRKGHIASAKVLIDAAKDLNAPLSNGSTPIDYTRQNGLGVLADQIAKKENDKTMATADALKPETKQPVTVMKRIRFKKDGLNI